MAGSHLILGALLSVVWAVQAAEHLAASRSHAASAALHTRSLEAAGSTNLRASLRRSRSSHSLQANVFRASRAGLKSGEAQRQVPLYVPKMGLANVTQPTPFPPPPPVLQPWKDHQPLDTAVGNYLISGFIGAPTATPPPTQQSIDLAFACPALITWPSEIAVSAPDACTSLESGNWTATSGDVQIAWETSCIDTKSPGMTGPAVSPVTTYSIPSTGDHFASSQERETPFGGAGSYTEVRDCGGALAYTIEEKVYKQAGQPDADACEKFKSCDGVIYFQYFIKNAAGAVVALSGYTTIFQENFDLTDTLGGKIVTVSRNGWDPDKKSQCAEEGKEQEKRLWNMKFAGSPPGIWAVTTNQWPLAVFMTMLSQREQFRQPNGQVLWSTCEVFKASGYALLGTVCCWCCISIPMLIFLICSAPIQRNIGDAETRFFPKRMGKPSMYGN